MSTRVVTWNDLPDELLQHIALLDDDPRALACTSRRWHAVVNDPYLWWQRTRHSGQFPWLSGKYEPANHMSSGYRMSAEPPQTTVLLVGKSASTPNGAMLAVYSHRQCAVYPLREISCNGITGRQIQSVTVSRGTALMTDGNELFDIAVFEHNQLVPDLFLALPSMPRLAADGQVHQLFVTATSDNAIAVGLYEQDEPYGYQLGFETIGDDTAMKGLYFYRSFVDDACAAPDGSLFVYTRAYGSYSGMIVRFGPKDGSVAKVISNQIPEYSKGTHRLFYIQDRLYVLAFSHGKPHLYSISIASGKSSACADPPHQPLLGWRPQAAVVENSKLVIFSLFAGVVYEYCVCTDAWTVKIPRVHVSCEWIAAATLE